MKLYAAIHIASVVPQNGNTLLFYKNFHIKVTVDLVYPYLSRFGITS